MPANESTRSRVIYADYEGDDDTLADASGIAKSRPAGLIGKRTSSLGKSRDQTAFLGILTTLRRGQRFAKVRWSMAQSANVVQLKPRTLQAFGSYIAEAEKGMDASLHGRGSFLWSDG